MSGNTLPAERESGTASAAAALRKTMVVLVLVTALGPLALNILVPSMPGLSRTLDAEYGTVQLVLSLYLIGVAIGQLAYGPLSDRYGRRPLLLIGLSVFLLGTTICLLAQSIATLIAGRVVQAVGGCAGLVLGRAIIRDLFEREEAARMIAYVTMAMVVVPMVAPTLGGLLDEWMGWRAGFVLVMVVGLAVWSLTLSVLRETHHHRTVFATPLGIARNSLRLLGMPAFRGYALQVTFSTSVFFAFIAGAPYIMIELLGRTPAEYGVYFVLVSLMFMLGNFTAAKLSTRAGMDRMILLGTALALVATAALLGAVLSVALTPLVLFGCMALVAFGNGLSLPNGMAGAISVDPALVGAASGLTGFLQMGTGALASFATGALLEDSARPLASIMLVAAALAFASHMLGCVIGRRQPREAGV